MSTTVSRKRTGVVRSAFLSGVSTLALCALTAPAFAQDAPAAAPADDVVVVTGVRGSLQRSMNIKKNATGIVDAISAEDIGKYPDTNLAESVQRIPGVAIDRVNGEGSQVTVRGFGPGFNLVTLNGRVLPTSNITTVGADQQGDFTSGTSRSFDFGNIASDGISGFEVYKTGKANVQSGGIGATLNIKTLRPLSAKAGSSGSVTVKALHTNVWESGKDITPEVSGAYNWVNEDKSFGVSLFGAYAERDGTTRSATVNAWNIRRGSVTHPGGGLGQPTTSWQPLPDATDWIAYPNDSRYHFSENHSERMNAQAVVQWRPNEDLTITADALFVENEQTEQRNDQTNWFDQIWSTVKFDGNDTSNTAYFLEESRASHNKDIGFEQQQRATKDKLNSVGLNLKWTPGDRMTFVLDAHSSKSQSLPNNPNGSSSTMFGVGAAVVAKHSVDFSSGFPVQRYTVDDAAGNNNGKLDLGDISTSVGRTSASTQTQKVDEVRLDFTYDFDGESRFDAGIDLRKSDMVQTRFDTQQILGGWGASAPGDVAQYAPGLMEAYCLGCLYEDFSPGDASVAFRGNAVDLLAKLSPVYQNLPGTGNDVSNTNNTYNGVLEEVMAAYGQMTMKGDFLGMPASVVAGLRYEKTTVTSRAKQAVPNAIVWYSDNDFAASFGTGTSDIEFEGEYDNWLPNIDISVNLKDDLIARASYSKTIARPDFGALFATTTVGNPNRPTAFGGTLPTAATGNPGLLPLESSNIDFSLEWYYGRDSYVSAGYYTKDVANFLGTGQVTQNLFGLRDPSSGATGSRSGSALSYINSVSGLQGDRDVNLFTMTALIDKHNGNVTLAQNEFNANLEPAAGGGVQLNSVFANNILDGFNITANTADPLMQFTVTQQINNRTANIHGFELSGQHFFGDTGLGVAASFTTVDGDVSFDRGAAPTVDQFALLGLSDTYNVTLIYDKNAISGRLSYNYRAEFLSGTNRDGSNRNPTFVAPFGILDLSVNYQLTPSIQLSFEGLNLTKEHLRTYARTETQLYFAQELDTRYQLGVRYKF